MPQLDVRIQGEGYLCAVQSGMQFITEKNKKAGRSARSRALNISEKGKTHSS